jgi:HSP20 family protein
MTNYIANYAPRRTFDPFERTSGQVLALSEVMDRLIRNSFVTPAKLAEGELNFDAPAMDVEETPEGYTVKAALAGWKPEDVDITFENGQLTLKGEWNQENEQKDDKTKWHHKEIRYNSFQRTVGLPIEIEADKAKANFENGMLTLTLPKAEVVKPKQIKIGSKNR